MGNGIFRDVVLRQVAIKKALVYVITTRPPSIYLAKVETDALQRVTCYNLCGKDLVAIKLQL